MVTLISAEQAAWMQSGVTSIVVASSSEGGRPAVGWALGSRVDEDRRQVVVFLLEAQSHDVLSDLRGGRRVSVLFTQSSNTRALQLKARGAREVALGPQDCALLDRYAVALADEWSLLGQPRPFSLALMSREGDTLVAFELTPEEAFDQTPGPRAGSQLKADS
ncbi:MAG TPA: hypothetical protein VIW29_08955 [Polyangiaceae bacterium]